MTSLDTSAAEHYLGERLGLRVPGGWGASIERYHQLLLRANEETNLTRIIEPDEFLGKHVVDSLLGVAVWPPLHEPGTRCIDVGCGAGVPGIVLALTLPALDVTLVDSSARKIEWVQRFLEELELRSARAIAGRAREIARRTEHAGAYDVVVARAVADASRLIRECRQLLAPGGALLAFKTPRQILDEEALVLREARKSGLEVDRSAVIELPQGVGARQFWIVRRGR